MNPNFTKISLLAVFLFLNTVLLAQQKMVEGKAVANLTLNKVLNSATPVSDLAGLQKKITIIDFFGTWCAPCLRAIPHLNDVIKNSGGKVSVVLVSNESEEKLQKFIKARSSFAFPIVVDEDNTIHQLFQPPSYPYTVVLIDGIFYGKVPSEEITDSALLVWEKNLKLSTPANSLSKVADKILPSIERSNNPIIKLSQEYIYKAKTGESLDSVNMQLAEFSFSDIEPSLQTDNDKKAFWINIYNGYTQAALSKNPEQYADRNAFFGSKVINIAGKKFSLDDIEHGILRRSKIKWSLGYLNKIFPSKTEKRLRVEKVDYRIHFALNCGAKSCPPIAFYDNRIIEEQLESATSVYLNGEASYDSSSNEVMVPKLMSWFRGDFGGKKGIIAILKKHNIVPAGVKPAIHFKDYDWSLSLSNYAKES